MNSNLNSRLYFSIKLNFKNILTHENDMMYYKCIKYTISNTSEGGNMENRKTQKIMPFIMLAFILAGSLQEAFNICAPIIAEDFSVTSADVSLISSIAIKNY